MKTTTKRKIVFIFFTLFILAPVVPALFKFISPGLCLMVMLAGYLLSGYATWLLSDEEWYGRWSPAWFQRLIGYIVLGYIALVLQMSDENGEMQGGH